MNVIIIILLFKKIYFNTYKGKKWFIKKIINLFLNIKIFENLAMGIGDWGLGIGDWGLLILFSQRF